VPVNEGLLRSVEIVAPEGSAVNPRFPAAVGCSSYHLGREITEAVSLALTQALPERATIPCTSLPMLTLAGEPGPGERYINQATITPGGCNAAPGADGWGWPGPQSGIDVSTPEMLERQYGIRVIERRLLQDSAGAGRWRGALGSMAVVEVVDTPVTATAFLAARGHPSSGLAGGWDGTPDAIVLRHGSPEPMDVDPLVYREVLQPGDRVAIVKGGGAGWGPPAERAPEAVRVDVQDGYISLDAARETYGVVIAADTQAVDRAATDALRSEMRGETTLQVG
jgi:N-methylhydantoinase B